MAQQYRHVIPCNARKLVLNHNLFDVFARDLSADLLAGILNSTFVALSKHQFGRFMGREGNLKTEVVDVKMMLVPDPRDPDMKTRNAIVQAFGGMRKRGTLPLSEEFALPDRNALDDAVLRLMGFSDPDERAELKQELYSEMTRIHREIRGAEVEMQKLRRITARRDRASPRTIAEEIWEEFDKTQIRVFPDDFISAGEPTETVALPAGKPRVLEALLEGQLQVNGTLIDLGSKARAEFAARAVELGHYGETQIPKADRACERALERYRHYEAQMDTKFKELAEERSADPEIQSRIVRELWKFFYASTRK
jgi:hypothetical protein